MSKVSQAQTCILSINHPNTLNYEYYKQYM